MSRENYTYDPASKPPAFGHPIRKYWAWNDDGYINLNHGSYGSLPLPVYHDAEQIALLAEKNPDRFHRITYLPLLDESRALVADLIGADIDEVALVPNATHGVNTVLRNFEWREGDVIIQASTTYGAVARTSQYLADRSEQPRPDIKTIPYTFPLTHTEIIDSFKATIREVKQSYPNSEFTDIPGKSPAGGKNKIVAVIDGIVSNPGVLLPWKELAKVCAEEGVWSVIDAAHSIGQELNINLSESKPDFWVSNCHKWLYVKRGCAVLYVPKRNQYIIKSSIPTSFGYNSPTSDTTDTNFAGQHSWTGTGDQAPNLSIKSALQFRKWIGGEEAINKYCHDLAISGGKKLAELLGTEVLDKTGELTLNMTNVRLPLPVNITGLDPVWTPELLKKADTILREKLLNEWNVYVAHYFHGGAIWIRASAQVWNEESDFEYAAKALNAISKELKETLFDTKNSSPN
ncbi:PLP-dependent transferase [Abortiporus biennis]|nr:PLP-dependent transferase [Abortiporus biennis]